MKTRTVTSQGGEWDEDADSHITGEGEWDEDADSHITGGRVG